jgi:two-component system cell cycle sensor histidine kinase PleC
MSHELRTPMNAILGFSEIMTLQTFGPMPDPYSEYAQLINRSGRHLLEIINQILDLAKIEAGRVELCIGHHAMYDVVEDVFELLTGAAALKRIDLVNRTECLHEVNFDRVRIRQALINVVGNAIKFTHTGSVTVRNQCGNGWHGLVIQDTGPGMTPAEVKEALKPFGQVGRDSSIRGAEGTGLGLTVTQQIMRLHRGEMLIDSVKGQGTTVTLMIPEGLNRTTRPDDGPR